MKLSKVSLFLSAVFCSTALICALLYGLIGSHIDGQSVLREPFFLLPVGWLSAALGVAFALLAAIGWGVARARKIREARRYS